MSGKDKYIVIIYTDVLTKKYLESRVMTIYSPRYKVLNLNYWVFNNIEHIVVFNIK